MSETELWEAVRGLLYSCVPDVDALELLVFLASQPPRIWEVEDLAAAIRPMARPAIRQYLSVFQEQKLLEVSGNGIVFRPATSALASAVAGVCKAYNERPVTLIRTVYSIADARKIQAFADAFRLKKEP